MPCANPKCACGQSCSCKSSCACGRSLPLPRQLSATDVEIDVTDSDQVASIMDQDVDPYEILGV